MERNNGERLKIKTTVEQNLVFNKEEVSKLEELEILYKNGHFKTLVFKTGTKYYQFDNWVILQELFFVLDRLMKLEQELLCDSEEIVKGKRLFRIDEKE